MLLINPVKKIRLGWLIILFLFCWLPVSIAFGFVYDSHGRKDPFSPPVIDVSKDVGQDIIAGIKLEGIIWDSDKPLAIINEKVVGVGEMVAGVKVISITQNEVIFDVNGEQVPVKLVIKDEEAL